MSFPHICNNRIQLLFYLRVNHRGLEVGNVPEKSENLYESFHVGFKVAQLGGVVGDIPQEGLFGFLTIVQSI